MTDTPAPVDISPEAVIAVLAQRLDAVKTWDQFHGRSCEIMQYEFDALRSALTARDRVLQQCEVALADAVMGKPVMLGPVLTEIRAILAKGETK